MGAAMLTADRPKWRGYTARDLQACAEREAKMRRHVYPNRLMTGRMSPNQARREIDLMEAIAEHFAELAETERLI
jgi:hypothetical protein